MQRDLKEILKYDLLRYDVKKCPALKFVSYYRKARYYRDHHKTFAAKLYAFLYYQLAARRSSEIPLSVTFGKGLYIGHFHGITINPGAIVGDNCNIHKNVSIGQQNRGERKGVPIIGNNVWIGINAVIVGKITVGDNVLIAPNSYVNRDVPPNSIVYGNPAIINPNENATLGYINNTV